MTKSKSSPHNKTKVTKAEASKSKAKAVKPSKSSSGDGRADKKEQIYLYLCEQYSIGIKEVNTEVLALAVGNKNPRSEGFSKPLQQLKGEDGLVTSKKGVLCLTEKGVASMPKDMEVSNDPQAIHDGFIALLEKRVKMGKEKVRPVWEILKDRQGHLIKDISEAVGYTNQRSFSNTKMVSIMTELGLVEKTGTRIQFTDKVPK